MTRRCKVWSVWSNKATKASSTGKGASTKASIRSSIALRRRPGWPSPPSSVNISNSDRLRAMFDRSSLSFVCSSSWLAFNASCIQTASTSAFCARQWHRYWAMYNYNGICQILKVKCIQNLPKTFHTKIKEMIVKYDWHLTNRMGSNSGLIFPSQGGTEG